MANSSNAFNGLPVSNNRSLGSSDLVLPSEAAVKGYIDDQIDSNIGTTSMKRILGAMKIYAGAATDVTSGQTKYHSIFPNRNAYFLTDEEECKIPMPTSGTVTDMYIYCTQNSDTGPGASSWIVTLRKNGADTGLAVTLTGAGQSGNNSTNVTFVAGDELSLSFEVTGGASDMRSAGVCLNYICT